MDELNYYMRCFYCLYVCLRSKRGYLSTSAGPFGSGRTKWRQKLTCVATFGKSNFPVHLVLLQKCLCSRSHPNRFDERFKWRKVFGKVRLPARTVCLLCIYRVIRCMCVCERECNFFSERRTLVAFVPIECTVDASDTCSMGVLLMDGHRVSGPFRLKTI